MPSPTLIDCFIRGAMVGAGMLAFGGLCWWMARMDRKRWDAERRERQVFRDRLSRVGHGGS